LPKFLFYRKIGYFSDENRNCIGKILEKAKGILKKYKKIRMKKGVCFI